MVELVKASQVIQTKKLPPTQGTSKPPSESYGKTKKPKKMIRVAGGQIWEDSTLMNWDHNDFRLFCGDLGNDVTDEASHKNYRRLRINFSSTCRSSPEHSPDTPVSRRHVWSETREATSPKGELITEHNSL